MSAVAESLDEYCPSCGRWVVYLSFNHTTGWCNECSGSIDGPPQCTQCGGVLPENHGRSTCPTCRRENWLRRHADEVEYLMIVKGYSFNMAREIIAQIVRPICRSCRKPIKGAHEGALFCKQNKVCHSRRNKYHRLVKRGMSPQAALTAVLQSK